MIDTTRLAAFVRLAAPQASEHVITRGLFEMRTVAFDIVRMNRRWTDGALTEHLNDVEQAERDAIAASEMRAIFHRRGIAEDVALRQLEASVSATRNAYCPPLKSEGKSNVARWCENTFIAVASIAWSDMTGQTPKPGKVGDALPTIAGNPYANFIAVAVEPVSIELGLSARQPAALYTHLAQTIEVGKFRRSAKTPS